jgi:hypothetical protein
MVESISWMEYPARSSDLATASKPRGAVASLLANDGKKKTTFLDIRYVPRLSSFSRIRPCVLVCHRRVMHLSFVDQRRLDLSFAIGLVSISCLDFGCTAYCISRRTQPDEPDHFHTSYKLPFCFAITVPILQPVEKKIVHQHKKIRRVTVRCQSARRSASHLRIANKDNS